MIKTMLALMLVAGIVWAAHGGPPRHFPTPKHVNDTADRRASRAAGYNKISLGR